MVPSFPNLTLNKSFWMKMLYRRSIFFINISWKIVFNYSKLLVWVKTSFMLINECSHPAINMINVCTISSKGLRWLWLFSTVVGSEDSTKWKAWIHCWTIPILMLRNFPTDLMGPSSKQISESVGHSVSSRTAKHLIILVYWNWFWILPVLEQCAYSHCS